MTQAVSQTNVPYRTGILAQWTLSRSITHIHEQNNGMNRRNELKDVRTVGVQVRRLDVIRQSEESWYNSRSVKLSIFFI